MERRESIVEIAVAAAGEVIPNDEFERPYKKQ
jgi:hypothetical protein